MICYIPFDQLHELGIQLLIPQGLDSSRHRVHRMHRDHESGMEISNGCSRLVDNARLLPVQVMFQQLRAFLLVCNPNSLCTLRQDRSLQVTARINNNLNETCSSGKKILLPLLPQTTFFPMRTVCRESIDGFLLSCSILLSSYCPFPRPPRDPLKLQSFEGNEKSQAKRPGSASWHLHHL